MLTVNASLLTEKAAGDYPLKSQGSVTVFDESNRHSLPLDLLLVLDVSTSMRGTGIRVVNDSMDYILTEMLGPEDRVAVITFNGSARVHCDWIDSGGSIAHVTASGNTNFGAAVKEMLTLLGAYSNDGERAGMALFLSDGQSQKAADQNVQSITSFGFTMHTIGVTDEVEPEQLDRMAELAGGHYYDAPEFDDVKAAFKTIFDHGKTVVYSTPELEIEVRDGVVLSNLQQVMPVGKQFADKLESGLHSFALSHLFKDTRIELAYNVEVSNISPESINELAVFRVLNVNSILSVRGLAKGTIEHSPANQDVQMITQTAKATSAIKSGDMKAATRAIEKLKNLDTSAASTRTKTLEHASKSSTPGQMRERLGRIQASTKGDTKMRVNKSDEDDEEEFF